MKLGDNACHNVHVHLERIEGDLNGNRQIVFYYQNNQRLHIKGIINLIKLNSDNPIQAIKILKEMTQMGLMEAKLIVDHTKTLMTMAELL